MKKIPFWKKWILGEKTTQELEKMLEDRNHNNIRIQSNYGLDDSYIFDFKNYSSGYFGNGTTPEGSPIPIDGPTENKTHKVRLTPVQALQELEKMPTPFSLELLDEKIAMLKTKRDLIVQHYSRNEIEGLIERLENRKIYKQHKDFFERFENTNDEKINKLIQNHPHLVMKTSDIFIPEFPDDAIQVMKEYTDKCMELFNKKPIFYVIADSKDFQANVGKRDPILLVQSPFGFYWQILGAWGEEMLVLSEL